MSKETFANMESKANKNTVMWYVNKGISYKVAVVAAYYKINPQGKTMRYLKAVSA